jgi:hypothetical protein
LPQPIASPGPTTLAAPTRTDISGSSPKDGRPAATAPIRRGTCWKGATVPAGASAEGARREHGPAADAAAHAGAAEDRKPGQGASGDPQDGQHRRHAEAAGRQRGGA